MSEQQKDVMRDITLECDFCEADASNGFFAVRDEYLTIAICPACLKFINETQNLLDTPEKTEGRFGMSNRYKTFDDGTVFPTMNAVAELNQKFRYDRDSVTKEDLLVAASCLSLLADIGWTTWVRKRELIKKFRETWEGLLDDK